jgi:hypothetical protein
MSISFERRRSPRSKVRWNAMQSPHVNAFQNKYLHLDFARALAVAAHDLDLISRDLGLVVQLECDVLD